MHATINAHIADMRATLRASAEESDEARSARLEREATQYLANHGITAYARMLRLVDADTGRRPIFPLGMLGAQRGMLRAACKGMRRVFRSRIIDIHANINITIAKARALANRAHIADAANPYERDLLIPFAARYTRFARLLVRLVKSAGMHVPRGRAPLGGRTFDGDIAT